MEKKQPRKVHLKNARPYNWYLDFKKREEEAKRKSDMDQPVETSDRR